MKDTTNHEVLAKAHENLSNDLANVSQLIQPQNQQALAALYKAQRRLGDIQELVKFASKAKPSGENIPGEAEKSEPLHLRLCDLNPLLNTSAEDTMMHVRCVLMALCELEFEDGASGEPGDFNLGLHDLFHLLSNTLKMHAEYGNELPDGVVLKQAEWQRAGVSS